MKTKLFLAGIAVLSGAGAAHAQCYPSKPTCVANYRVVPAQAGTQVVTQPEGPEFRCCAWDYIPDCGLRRNDDGGLPAVWHCATVGARR